MGKSIPLGVRLWSRARYAGSDECWEWTGSRNPSGYGQIYYEGTMASVHRVAYMLTYGDFDPALDVHHLCENKGCVNPRHLELISRSEHRRLHNTHLNGARAMLARTHCPQGHPYDEANTAYRPKTGSRVCRKCENIRQREWQAKRAALRNGHVPVDRQTCPTCHRPL